MRPTDTVTEKTCTRCKKTKPLELFGVVKNKTDGRKACCKKCHSELSVEYNRRNPEKSYAGHRRWAKAHPEHMKRLKRASYERSLPYRASRANPSIASLRAAKALLTEKPCIRCGITQSMQNYRPAKITADGRTAQCRDCIAKRVRAWYKKTQTKRREKARRLNKLHPEWLRQENSRRKARNRNVSGSHTAAEWLRLCARFDNRCVRCGVAGKKLTKDHVIPLTRPGASHNISNIQPMCVHCNASKGQHAIDYRETPFINQGRLLELPTTAPLLGLCVSESLN